MSEQKKCNSILYRKSQRIVTGGETVDDIYLGHVTIQSHLIIASRQCFWAIDQDSREPWCISWSEISHFSIERGNSLTLTVFSPQGPHSFVFDMSLAELTELQALLSMQTQKMVWQYCAFRLSALMRANILIHQIMAQGNMNALGTMSYANLPGIKSPQKAHIFGSLNEDFKAQLSDLDSEAKLVERCNSQVTILNSALSDYFIRLDQAAWHLVNCSTQLFTGLSSRRCVLIGLLNGANETIQIKSNFLIEGGSPCYTVATDEYNKQQGTLKPGGAVIMFGWGAAPSLLQPGRVLMKIETNLFSCSMSDRKGRECVIHSLPGYQVGSLEKSYDESGWWAKYWILIKKEDKNNSVQSS